MTKKITGTIVLMAAYEDRQCARRLLGEIAGRLADVSYIIVVEDGSVKDPVTLGDITQTRLTGEVIYLARNVGHQRAIAIGLTHIAATLQHGNVVVMDCDGEDRPDSIPTLLAQLQTGKVDAVVAQRRRRSDPMAFRLFYNLYRFVFQLLTGRAIAFGNFAALSPSSVRRLAAMHEVWLHFASALMVSRLRIGYVPTDRGKRYFGHSQMNFLALVLHGMRSLMVFADDVLVRIVLFCSLIAAIAFASLATTTTLKFLGFATPGWFSTLSGILIVILFQAGTLTFVTLMLAGSLRAGFPPGCDQLARLIDHIETASELRGAQVPTRSGAERSDARQAVASVPYQAVDDTTSAA
jgi:polyisoprenyl-phosphate glycosyltransferase